MSETRFALPLKDTPDGVWVRVEGGLLWERGTVFEAAWGLMVRVGTTRQLVVLIKSRLPGGGVDWTVVCEWLDLETDLLNPVPANVHGAQARARRLIVGALRDVIDFMGGVSCRP